LHFLQHTYQYFEKAMAPVWTERQQLHVQLNTLFQSRNDWEVASRGCAMVGHQLQQQDYEQVMQLVSTPARILGFVSMDLLAMLQSHLCISSEQLCQHALNLYDPACH
jgi:hypothetical protein